LNAALAEAQRRKIPITVAVVDAGGYMVIAERLDGASLASSQTVLLKVRSAVLWQRATSTWLPAIEASHGSQTTYPDVYAGGGGDIILSSGRIIGGIGVGGSTPDIETEIARAAVSVVK
jgi:glc operon protein GlcG